MARWKVTQNCTLPIDGIFFEQKLTTNTGRPCTEKWPAHQLFMVEDPPDPTMFNDVDELGIPMVCVSLKPFKRDWVIDPVALKKGWMPNPGMEPLDAEARAISAKIPKGIFPMSEMALPATGNPMTHSPDAGPSRLEQMLMEMNARLEALAQRNAELEELLRPPAEEPVDDSATVQ